MNKNKKTAIIISAAATVLLGVSGLALSANNKPGVDNPTIEQVDEVKKTAVDFKLEYGEKTEGKK